MKRSGTLRSGHALHTANIRKSKYKKKKLSFSSFLHYDTIKSLCFMKRTMPLNPIHDIELIPFSVDYWTKDQIHAYKRVCKIHGGSVCMNTTVVKMLLIDKPFEDNQMHNICLYLLCVHCEEGQFAIAQRLDENHTTVDASKFLSGFQASGAPDPKEFVCDGARVHLNAAADVYGRCKSIEEYADKITNTDKIKTRIRMDVAHFQKTYKQLLKGENNRRVRWFYMAAIKHLTESNNMEEVEKIMKAIFLLSSCETVGLLPNGEPTECSKSKAWLINLVTVDRDDEDEQRNVEEENEALCEQEDSRPLNSWGRWGHKMFNAVSKFFDQEGSEVNAYYLGKINICKKLLKDSELFPIWGNILNEKFNFGRIPATITPAEIEANRLKTLIINKYKFVRPDRFVDDHINYLKEKMLIINAELNKSIDIEADGKKI